MWAGCAFVSDPFEQTTPGGSGMDGAGTAGGPSTTSGETSTDGVSTVGVSTVGIETEGSGGGVSISPAKACTLIPDGPQQRTAACSHALWLLLLAPAAGLFAVRHTTHRRQNQFPVY